MRGPGRLMSEPRAKGLSRSVRFGLSPRARKSVAHCPSIADAGANQSRPTGHACSTGRLPMTLKRRDVLRGVAGSLAAAPLAAPRITRAAGQSTLTFVPQADLAILDPVWTTA